MITPSVTGSAMWSSLVMSCDSLKGWPPLQTTPRGALLIKMLYSRDAENRIQNTENSTKLRDEGPQPLEVHNLRRRQGSRNPPCRAPHSAHDFGYSANYHRTTRVHLYL